jgi:Transposase DDE domain
MIIGTIAPPVQRFYQRFLKGADGVGVCAGIVLPILLHGLLLATKRRTLKALGEATLVHWVCAGTVCRWLARVRFPVDRWYEHCFRQMLQVAAHLNAGDDWVVIFDGTDSKRGGLAKIQNMRRYKKEKKGKKGRPSTKTHTFLFGLLILPSGIRLPLPRKSWYTRAYAKERALEYKTQVDLTAELLLWLKPLLPKAVHLVVLADSYFEGMRLFGLCHQEGWSFISKLKRNRCFADSKTRIVSYGSELKEGLFWRHRLRRGKEATAAYRRQEPRKSRLHENRAYDIYSECRQVSKLGEARVVYSWKTPVYTPRPRMDQRQFVALVTNDLQMSPKRIVELYELRWQIEVFFREMKGQLGLTDYQGTQFESYERYITLTLLGFLVLEYERLRGLKGQSANEEPAGGWAAARTSVLLQVVRRETTRQDVHWLRDCLKTPSGRRRLRKALDRAA